MTGGGNFCKTFTPPPPSDQQRLQKSQKMLTKEGKKVNAIRHIPHI